MKVVTLMAVAIVLSAAAAGCGSEPVSPAAPADVASLDRINQTDRFPIAGVTFNPCTPAEPIAYDGFIHINRHGEVEPGSTDIRTQVVLHAQGIGLVTGSKYVLQSNQKSEFVFNQTPFGLESERSLYTRFLRQGSQDNFFVETSFKIVCDASGCRIIENEQERSCRG